MDISIAIKCFVQGSMDYLNLVGSFKLIACQHMGHWELLWHLKWNTSYHCFIICQILN